MSLFYKGLDIMDRKEYFQRLSKKTSDGDYARMHIVSSKKVDSVVTALSKSFRTSKSKIIDELLWRGFVHLDQERVFEGKKSVTDVFDDFNEKEANKYEKELQRQLRKETIGIANYIWGLDSKDK